MAVELEINGSLNRNARYISNAASPCRLRLTPPATATATVTLSSRPVQTGGGEAVFYASRSQPSTESLTLTLPANGSWVSFEIGGKFGFPSVNDQDCLLTINGLGAEITFPLMVRIRKNANNLTTAERDRFLAALFQLNLAGTGIYQDFRDIHVAAADAEEHGGPHFLPWHRAFLLDLERELQAVDPSVSLPYWRFDRPAQRIFRADFMGATRRVSPTGSATLAVFNNTNPLAAWATDGVPGIRRSAIFNPATSPAPGPSGFPLLSQTQTLALGNRYAQFQSMEASPHGAAHVSFLGSISAIATAVKDPLFFLLHANVDRLWALWQWLNQRTDPQATQVYTPQNRDGRRLADTMWPWNGVITPPRPNAAPGGPLPPSPITAFPDAMPKVQNVIDFQGHNIPAARLGYGYDNVPYEFS
jgi:tyrosinase